MGHFVEPFWNCVEHFFFMHWWGVRDPTTYFSTKISWSLFNRQKLDFFCFFFKSQLGTTSVLHFVTILVPKMMSLVFFRFDNSANTHTLVEMEKEPGRDFMEERTSNVCAKWVANILQGITRMETLFWLNLQFSLNKSLCGNVC